METRNSMKIFKRSKDKGSIDVGSLVKKYTERMEGHTVLNQGSWGQLEWRRGKILEGVMAELF